MGSIRGIAVGHHRHVPGPRLRRADQSECREQLSGDDPRHPQGRYQPMIRFTHSLRRRAAAFALLTCGCAFLSQAQDPSKPLTPEERMKWFREAKFGLFIHWGLYAIPAGEWKGKAIPGIGE